ncbi:FecR domain-containing protein [Hymenobacter sp. HSC-4F20]|uniref:FecR family protein n=1 Tax=Hymenobacter sp. HSC-4F20 TaxID=2864135 RepID=UPI001C72AAFB|nr:FecR domain-containing protein [Hymenobacter sp. HSC-4F20]MBX0289265.1 FecR domain-containing protein [Hymenobacter sp. HSC-4F20]
MPSHPDKSAFLRYINGTASAVEAAAVRAWLTEPTNQFLARHWMEEHWHSFDATSVASAAEPDYEVLLQTLHQRLQFTPEAAADQEDDTTSLRPRSQWRYWAAAAATAALVTAGGALWWQQQNPAGPLTYATTYGQTRTLHLPDGSAVTLNGNSTLRYAPAPASGQPREVWLDGEAFFAVRHTPSNQRFIVHTTAGFNVEVLGTQFTVFRRRQEARVVLLSGKVRVDFEDSTRADLLMKPGELVQTQDDQPRALVHKPVHTAAYASWKDEKLVLDNTSITELTTRLHDTYGLEVEVATPALRTRRMTGTVPVQDLDLLLKALEETFHLKAERQQNRLILSDSTAP